MSEKFEGNLPPQGQKEDYPEDFKTRVQAVFPDWDRMHTVIFHYNIKRGIYVAH